MKQRSRHRLLRLILVVASAGAASGIARAEDFALHSFDRQELTAEYYSEGIAVGDINHDGTMDIVYGPHWYAGPDFKEKHEIYPATPQPKDKYADHFFAWVYDFNNDGWPDVLTAGFPGTPGYVYENPGAKGFDKPWPKHKVIDHVSNEAPQFVNIVGDEKPELICTSEGYFGYATFNPAKPFEPWVFHRISEKIAPVPFGHGLGVGDVDGDGRPDLLMKDGWFQQPPVRAVGGPALSAVEGPVASTDSKPWVFHPVKFAPNGAAEMYVYDVDGDGDNDVITCLGPHDFGLMWHEQMHDGNGMTFVPHLIMGDHPENNRHGVVFSELHSLALADIDGDGLKDIVTGKTYYSHHEQSRMWNAGAVVYWFRLTRTVHGVEFVPYKADGESGIGRQVVVADVNKDGLPDIVTGGMKGAHVLTHRRQAVSEQQWIDAQPKVIFSNPDPAMHPVPAGKPAAVKGLVEGEDLPVLRVTGGKTSRQDMTRFKTGDWSGGQQLFWRGAKPGDKLDLELKAPVAGNWDVAIALTKAKDYGIIQLSIDGAPLGGTLDLFNANTVISTGAVVIGQRQLTAGSHTLTVEMKGANPAAVKSYLVGVDTVRLIAK